MAGSVEAGLHNAAYTADTTDANDVIMMMATKQHGEEKRQANARKRVMPPMYKVR